MFTHKKPAASRLEAAWRLQELSNDPRGQQVYRLFCQRRWPDGKACAFHCASPSPKVLGIVMSAHSRSHVTALTEAAALRKTS